MLSNQRITGNLLQHATLIKEDVFQCDVHIVFSLSQSISQVV